MIFDSKKEQKTGGFNVVFNALKTSSSKGEVAVIGAGWFGSHIAIWLQKNGYSVTLYEKNKDIFSGISGKYGIRAHAGPHYPRSYKTRMFSRAMFHNMLDIYPEVCHSLVHSFYVLGKQDATGNASKVGPELFDSIVKEFKCKGQVDISFLKSSSVYSAYDVDEYAVSVGQPLRIFFKKKLELENVTLQCNFSVSKVEKTAKGYWVGNGHAQSFFNHVVDTTGFQRGYAASLKKPLPFNMEVVYQVCFSLFYKQRQVSKAPFAFIVMDGMYPCLMPYLNGQKGMYIMTNGKFTTLHTAMTYDEAAKKLYQIKNDTQMERKIQQCCEKEMLRFWPSFLKDFSYQGWDGTVLAKIKTGIEFRSAVTFQDPDTRVITVFPGKVTHIFEIANEVEKLMVNQSVTADEYGYRYVKSGLLALSRAEIKSPIKNRVQNTCCLMTHDELLRQKKETHQDKSSRQLKKEQSVVSRYQFPQYPVYNARYRVQRRLAHSFSFSDLSTCFSRACAFFSKHSWQYSALLGLTCCVFGRWWYLSSSDQDVSLSNPVPALTVSHFLLSQRNDKLPLVHHQGERTAHNVTTHADQGKGFSLGM